MLVVIRTKQRLIFVVRELAFIRMDRAVPAYTLSAKLATTDHRLVCILSILDALAQLPSLGQIPVALGFHACALAP
jgi:hypothetical protein